MKYELGDKVKITKYWRKKILPEGFEDYLKENQEEFAGGGVEYKKYEKINVEEIGYISGIRQQKISTTLSWELEEGMDFGEFGTAPDFEGIRQLDSKHIQVYLVATRMNCLRRVSFEDIEFLGGKE